MIGCVIFSNRVIIPTKYPSFGSVCAFRFRSFVLADDSVSCTCSNIAINFLSQNKLIGNAGEDDEDYDPHIIRELIKIVFMNTIDGKSTVAQHRAHNEALYAIAEALRYVFDCLLLH